MGGSRRLREEEDALLREAGFEPVGSSELWVKGRVCYGKEAALQATRRGKTGAPTRRCEEEGPRGPRFQGKRKAS